jgi:hypothetical protein
MTIKALYPTVRPTLNLDFAKTKALDPRVTFTRASTGTFVGSNGLIQTAASGAARFDHNPATGESLGLLVEEARTNLITYSQAFNSTNYTAGYDGGGFTENATVAPDGTTTASKLTRNAGTSGCFWSKYNTQAIPVVNSTVYTISCYLKAAEISVVTMSGDVRDGGGLLHSAVFTLTGNGSYTLNNGTSAQIVNAGNGWYRCSVTGTATATDTEEPGLIVFGTGTSGQGFYAWGFQLEAGAFPTSYIPTTTATVTRAADVASMTGTNFSSWWNSTASTFLVTGKTSTNRTAAGGGYGYLGTLPITGYVYYLLYVNGPEVATFDGTNKANVNVSDQSQTHEMAVALTTANQYVVTDGGSVATTAYNNARSASTGLTIGKSLAELNGTIARLAYYPVRLPDAQLQALTAT